MRTNKYEATVCEVYHEENGDLYAVVTRSVTGDTKTHYTEAYNEQKGI